MKLSITTNITNPILRGDNYLEAIQNYAGLADEVIVVDGGSTDGSLEEIAKLGLDNVKVVYYEWKHEWDWEQIPRSMNFGIEQCTGDWAIKMDIDRFFLNSSFKEIRSKLNDEMLLSDSRPIASFICYNFPRYNKYFCKGYRASGINISKFGDKYKLGKATNEFLSLSHPVKVDGCKDGIYYGIYNTQAHVKVGVPMFNFDGTFKEKKHIEYFWQRYWNAYCKYYKTKMPFKKGKAVEHYMEFHKPEVKKSVAYRGEYPLSLTKLIKDINSEQYGFNSWE